MNGMDPIAHDRLVALARGPLHAFAAWPLEVVPHVAAGLYSVWKGEDFIYIGMSGRGLSEADIEARRRAGERKKALWSRLDSHASGRRSGDQFCLYVCDRFVLPELEADHLADIGAGRVSLDRLTREWIRAHLAFRFVEVPSGTEALRLEDLIRKQGLGGRLPILNGLGGSDG